MLYSRLFLLSGANIKLFIEYPLKKRLNICEYDILFIPLHPLSRTKVKWTAGQLSWLERRIHNPEVRGSQPRPATKRLIIIMITNLFVFYTILCTPQYEFKQTEKDFIIKLFLTSSYIHISYKNTFISFSCHF